MELAARRCPRFAACSPSTNVVRGGMVLVEDP
jgi:hypothetical protein